MGTMNNVLPALGSEKPAETFAGVTIDEIRAAYFDAEALREPPYRVYQMNLSGARFYYRLNEAGEAEFYPSVTTILSRTMLTPPSLIKWIADKGYDAAEAYKNERAAYGTFMHAIFEELLIARAYDLDALQERLARYIEREQLPTSFIHHAAALRKDLMSFAQFLIDYDVRPLAVEVALVHPHAGYAGMVDLACTMLTKIGGTERTTAIVDFKSGKNGFHEDYEIQLGLYREMWNEAFPDMPIERIYNFAPKDWRKAPTYTLKNQTASKALRKIPHLLALAGIEFESEGYAYTHISGVVDLRATDLSANIRTLSLSELVAYREATPSEGVNLEETAEISAQSSEPINTPPQVADAVKSPKNAL